MKRKKTQKRAVSLERMIETAGHVQLGEKTSWDPPKPKKPRKKTRRNIRSATIIGQKNEYVVPSKRTAKK